MRSYGIARTEIQAPSSAAECSRLRKIVCRLASKALRSSRAVSDLEVAVGEAFSNAVKYGNRGTKVCVRVESPSPSELAVEMAYEGQCFDTQVKCPSSPENSEGGFGRFIMQQLTDSMEYSFNDGHTRVKMTKYRR